MTAKPKPQPRVCYVCKYDGGIHYEVPEDGGEIIAKRCPNWLAAELHEQAVKLTETQNEAVKEAAHRIVADAAETLPSFSANDCHDAFEAAQIPEQARGGAFQWAANQGLIRKTERRVMSRKATTRRDLPVWESLRYGKRAGAA